MFGMRKVMAAVNLVDQIVRPFGYKAYFFNDIRDLDVEGAGRIEEGAFLETTPEEAAILRECNGGRVRSFNRTYAVERRPVFCTRLNEVLLEGGSGAIGLDDHTMLLDSQFSYGRLIFNGAYRRPFLQKAVRIEGPCASIYERIGKLNNWHILIDFISRLYALSKTVPELTLIIPEKISGWEMETLELYRPEFKRLDFRTIRSNEVFLCRDYYFSSFVATDAGPFYSPTIREWLRRPLQRIPHDVTRRRKLYVTRINSKKRCLVNEAEVHQVMEANGFEIIRAEEYSVEDKVRLFAEAEMVVGPHGAGLANILFSRDAKMLEIYDPSWRLPYFPLFARTMGYRYRGVAGEPEGKRGDFSVDLEGLERSVREMG